MMFVFKEYAAKIQGKYACALVEAKGNQKRKAMMLESLQYFCKNSQARNNSHYFRHTNVGQHSLYGFTISTPSGTPAFLSSEASLMMILRR